MEHCINAMAWSPDVHKDIQCVQSPNEDVHQMKPIISDSKLAVNIRPHLPNFLSTHLKSLSPFLSVGQSHCIYGPRHSSSSFCFPLCIHKHLSCSSVVASLLYPFFHPLTWCKSTQDVVAIHLRLPITQFHFWPQKALLFDWPHFVWESRGLGC